MKKSAKFTIESSGDEPLTHKGHLEPKNKPKPPGKEGVVWDLDDKKRVTISEFKGKVFVDIREFYEKDGELFPGKKGISLKPEHFAKLVEFIPQISAQLAAKINK